MRKPEFIGMYLFLWILLSSFSTFPDDTAIHSDNPEPVITIIYDNYSGTGNLTIDWGFSCLVEYRNYRLLFDAGRNPEIFRKNLELLDIDPATITSLFISHSHGDHTGGMQVITSGNKNIKCYLPGSFAKELEPGNRLPPVVIPVTKPLHLFGPFYSTGEEFVAFREQGLVVKVNDAGILITGCGHPGIVEMVSAAKNSLGIEITMVIGGLHLLQNSEQDVKDIAEELKKMGVKKICPTHCTGAKAIAILKESFAEGYIEGGTGRVIK